MTRDPHWFAASLAWNDYTDALRRGASDDDIRWYRERYERVRAARWEFWWRAAAKPGTAERLHAAARSLSAGSDDTALVLAQPRRVTSTAIAKVFARIAAGLIPAFAVLGALPTVWAIGVAAAPILIYVWWMVTEATIRAADELDEHQIPPARVLSEGPR
jgi:hypothetical protein